MTKQIILASNSPRRKELLKAVGLKFKVIPSRFQENLQNNMQPHRLAKKLALGKAREVALRIKTDIVIGADTIVVLKGKILGKPQDAKDAIKMLKSLSGKTHLVITAFAILNAKTGQSVVKSLASKVVFRNISNQEILKYIATKEPMDKAGAYAIQGRGAALIRKIQGDYFNIVGLPIFNLLIELKQFGVKVM